jgi:hypothetical protein
MRTRQGRIRQEKDNGFTIQPKRGIQGEGCNTITFKITTMIPTIDFKNKYPGVTIYENMGIQDEFTMRLEVFVPQGKDVEPRELASDASYYYRYFSGRMVGKEDKENGTLYLIDAWKD